MSHFPFCCSQNTVTDEELARRHQEGVDAFLSFASEVSSMSSPLKRPPSADFAEIVHHYGHDNDNNNNNTHNQRNHTNNNTVFMNNSHSNGNYYYDSGSSSSPSPPKKSRSQRTKLKKRVWLR